MPRQEITIEGMGCDHCIATVRGVLERVDGVNVESVELGSARVAFDPDTVSVEQIDAAIHDAGYEPVAHQNV